MAPSRTRLLLVMLLVVFATTVPAVSLDTTEFLSNLTINGSKECGPETDWDCTTAEAQGKMIMAYSAMFKATGVTMYKNRAKNLANAKVSGAAGCAACACDNAGDFDCGTATDQATLILSLLAAFEYIGEPMYYSRALLLGNTATSECGPDADFDIGGSDWECGDVSSQNLMILAYARLFEDSGEEDHLDAVKKLADNCNGVQFQGSLHPCSTGLIRAYHLTRDDRYKDQFFDSVREQDGLGKLLVDNLVYYRFTGEDQYRELAVSSGNEGSSLCGPGTDDWDCDYPATQGWFITSYAALYEFTNDTTYKGYMDKLADVDQPCGSYEDGDAWECATATEQAQLMIGLASALVEKDLHTAQWGLDDLTSVAVARKDAGDACMSNADCLSGNCKSQVCCLADQVCCTKDAHCPPDNMCDTERFYCIEALTVEPTAAPGPSVEPQCTPCPEATCPEVTPEVVERIVEKNVTVTVTVPAETTPCPPAPSCGPQATACPSCPSAESAPSTQSSSGSVAVLGAVFGLLAGLVLSAMMTVNK
ncbi:MAG: hypothetical protein QGG50_01140 [Methanopyri archaeon]|nr:hypothetical protein [Methanopyri archaeon]